MNTYDMDEQVELSVTVKKADGTLIDATVALSVRKPDGTTVTPTVVHDGLGRYHADVTLNLDGGWRYRWQASGAASAVRERALHVRRSLLATAP